MSNVNEGILDGIMVFSPNKDMGMNARKYKNIYRLDRQEALILADEFYNKVRNARLNGNCKNLDYFLYGKGEFFDKNPNVEGIIFARQWHRVTLEPDDIVIHSLESLMEGFDDLPFIFRPGEENRYANELPNLSISLVYDESLDMYVDPSQYSRRLINPF